MLSTLCPAAPPRREFVDEYLLMVKACAEQDREGVVRRSTNLGFLTGRAGRSLMRPPAGPFCERQKAPRPTPNLTQPHTHPLPYIQPTRPGSPTHCPPTRLPARSPPGDESRVMLDAHVEAGFHVGVPFGHDGIYDFGEHGKLTKVGLAGAAGTARAAGRER